MNQHAPCISAGRIAWAEGSGLSRTYQIRGYDLVDREVFSVPNGDDPPSYLAGMSGTRLLLDGRGAVLLVDLATGEITRLGLHASGTAPAVISGDSVVWEDLGEGGWDLVRYDIGTGMGTPLCSAPGYQGLPAISGDTVVWCDDRDGDWEYDIWGYDLSRNTEFPICTTPGQQIAPAVSGDTVVWIERGSSGAWGWENSSLWVCDLETMESRRLTGTTGPGEDPAISGDIVVWMKRSQNDIGIWGYDLSCDTAFPVSDAPGYQWHPAIDGNVVVWEDGPVEGPPPMRIRGAVLAPDTQPPITIAYGATITAGGSGRLRFRIADPTPSCGRAVVTIQVRKRGVVVDSVTVGTRRTNRPLGYVYAPTLARGRYSWRVLATDLAGNTAVTRESAILTVK